MNETKNVLILLTTDEVHRKRMREAAPAAHIIFLPKDELTGEQIARANVIVGNPPLSLLPRAEKLEWLQLESAGANRFTEPGVLKETTLLTNATGCFGLSISEYMICMVLSLFQNQKAYRENQRKHLWHDEGRVKSIFGSTALAVGLGDIGGEFAKRFRALGGSVIGMRRSNAEKPDYVDELYLMDRLDELLPRADVVALSLPETAQTRGLFGAERLARMKPGAVLINVGRGSAVDSSALCDALNAGRLGGAALDVTEPEPLPPEHPLWDARNALITPHVSGGYDLPETYERVFRLCTDNLGRYFRGEPLHNPVDFKTGYKKSGV